jgi:hypothetical protein
MKAACLILALTLPWPVAGTPAVGADKLTRGAKVFVQPMKDGFDTYFKAALAKKKVPLVVVPSREEADYEITGTSESQKAGAAKKIIMGSWHSDEQASISVAGIKSGEIVFAYAANKKNSAHGKQTTAEACAKHLKEAIEKGK